VKRYLFRIGGHEVHSYKAMLFIGCVAGVYAGAAVARERGLDESRFSLTVVALLIPAFAGARLWFVARHLDVYRGERRRIVARSEGGSALFGGLALAFAASVPVLSVAGLPLWAFWDAASVTMLVGLIFTRIGCLMNGCCAGRTTTGPLGLWLPNAFGEWQRRYPTQLLEAVWAGVLLVLALATRSVLFEGALFVAVVGLYCAGRVALEAAREQSHAPRTVQALWP
jgi:phosphatidylglycerol---prolipoprotein diacylglyceryl transferase